MAQAQPSQISLSICRIRKLLLGDQGVILGKATSGSGCIVTLDLGGDASSASGAPKRSPVLITTTQVISKDDLISPSTSIIVEVLDGRDVLTFTLDFKKASDFPDPIPGRVLGGTRDALKEESFMVIPVGKFDNRAWFKRKLSSLQGTSFEKRSLTCNYQSDENIQSAISRRKLLCHVIRDGRSDTSYNAEPYCLEFGRDTSEYVLTSPLDHDGADGVKQLKDFHKEEKPRGAPLLDAEGKFVGMLVIAPSDERKLFPLFLPTQNGRSTSYTLSDAQSSFGPRSHSDIFSPYAFSRAFHPRLRRNTIPAELEHLSPGSLVKDKIVSKVKVMDMLSLHLDRSLCPGSRDATQTQRWEHFADVLKVPDERKRQCENFTGMLSPSENMFQYLCSSHNPDDPLTVKRIKDHLRKIGRKDVVAELEKNTGLYDDDTVADLCENHPDTLNVMCLKLDDKRGPINWHDLGLELGITGKTLWTFQNPSGYSPSKVILQKLETLLPDLCIMTIEAALEDLKLPAIARLLNDLEDGSTIKTLLDNSDVLDEVTAMLDRRESFWYGFGQKFEIDRKDLDSLKPDPIASPTKVLMECIVQEYPNLNMKTFLETLAKIKRNDVIKELKTFFHPNDIDDIVPPESLRH